jgi:hypothetical protein
MVAQGTGEHLRVVERDLAVSDTRIALDKVRAEAKPHYVRAIRWLFTDDAFCEFASLTLGQGDVFLLMVK